MLGPMKSGVPENGIEKPCDNLRVTGLLSLDLVLISEAAAVGVHMIPRAEVMPDAMYW